MRTFKYIAPMLISQHDSYKTVADKIFKWFILNQIVVVRGVIEHEGEFVAKGKMVRDELNRLDIVHNFRETGNGKMSRVRKKLSNSIGGYVEDKIFRYAEEINEQTKEVKWTFWRAQ